MSGYFRWMKSKNSYDIPYQKPRSNSLDPRSLEASGIRNFTSTYQGSKDDLIDLVGTTNLRPK